MSGLTDFIFAIGLCAFLATGRFDGECATRGFESEATPDGSESFSPCASLQCKHASRKLRTPAQLAI
jgi:hypothetical protein